MQRYIKCNNISSDPHSFIIDPIDYINVSSKYTILFICHSHLDVSAQPSESDTYGCNKGSVPWIIYSLMDKTLVQVNPSNEKVPYTGRQYFFGSLDCWGLVGDVYEYELNIKLIRPFVTSSQWFTTAHNLFEEYASINNFIKVSKDTLKKYDVILFTAGRSKVPNHSGIKYDGNTFIHHLENRLSTKEIYGGYWNKCTHSIYRHKSLI